MKDKIYTKVDEVRREIDRDTDKIAGENKGICPDPISVKFYSSKVLSLTLVDLPGLTKVNNTYYRSRHSPSALTRKIFHLWEITLPFFLPCKGSRR